MKKYNTKPIETLTIEFVDRTTRELKFGALAMCILDEEYEGFIAIANDAKVKPFLSGAKLIYAGAKAIEIEKDGESKITYNDAKRLIVNMTVEDIAGIFEFATVTMGEQKPQQK
jgi:hypothetical protein